MSERPRVGFVGLGVMGKPMALNLLAAGFPLTVHNRSQGAVEELVAAGAEGAVTPREVAERSEITITMLPDTGDVEAVYRGPEGLLGACSPGDVLIDMSTISPDAERELAAAAAESGATLLDAPVSGGDVGAREGTLSIMVGGEEEALGRVRPVLEAVGTTIVHVGPIGAGQIVKACNQVVVAMTIQAVSEALMLASRAGVDLAKMLEVLSGGLAANRVIELRQRNFLEHDFTPGFKARLHHKDLGIALDAARRHAVVLPGAAAVDQLLESLLAQGLGESDHSALLVALEGLSNHQITTEGDSTR